MREFARATGRLARTDRLDAEVLAQFGDTLRPPVRPLPDAQLRELGVLVTRRRQLIAMQTQERNRRRQMPARVAEQIDQRLTLLAEQIAQLDRDIAALVWDNAGWQAQAKLLRSIPGVGPVPTATLLAELPELGRASHQEIAALVRQAQEKQAVVVTDLRIDTQNVPQGTVYVAYGTAVQMEYLKEWD